MNDLKKNMIFDLSKTAFVAIDMQKGIVNNGTLSPHTAASIRIDAAVCGESVPLFTIPFCMSIATKAVFDKSKIIFFFKSFMMFLLSNNNVFYVSKSLYLCIECVFSHLFILPLNFSRLKKGILYLVDK